MSSSEAWAGFLAWAAGRPKTSSFADGFAFAKALDDAGALPDIARPEMAAARRSWRLEEGVVTARRHWFPR